MSVLLLSFEEELKEQQNLRPVLKNQPMVDLLHADFTHFNYLRCRKQNVKLPVTFSFSMALTFFGESAKENAHQDFDSLFVFKSLQLYGWTLVGGL